MSCPYCTGESACLNDNLVDQWQEDDVFDIHKFFPTSENKNFPRLSFHLMFPCDSVIIKTRI